jgi:hypothetical protein
LPRVSTTAWLSAALAVMLTAAGCGEPPQKELDQAQAAIEVAVSAGAERFASLGLASARTALIQARDAVNQRDYRLALSHALDSREKAQAAARAAADARATLRREVETTLADVTTRLDRARAVIADGRSIPRARLRRARAAEVKLTTAVQEARAAVDAQDYGKAQTLLTGLEKDLAALVAAVQGQPPAQSSRGTS